MLVDPSGFGAEGGRDPLSVSTAGIRRNPFSVGASFDFRIPGMSLVNMALNNPRPTGVGFGIAVQHNSQGGVEGMLGSGGVSYDVGLQTGNATATVDFISGTKSPATTVEGFLGLGGKVYLNGSGSIIGIRLGVGYSPNFLHKALQWLSGSRLPVTNIGTGAQYDFGNL